MEINYILIWIVCLSCLIFIIRTIRSSINNNLGWLTVASLIILITLTLAYLTPNVAGIIGCFIWWLFLLTPLSLLSEINQLLYQEKYTKVQKLAQSLKYLHPFDGILELPQLLSALDIAHQGDLVTANQIIENYQNKSNHFYYNAKIILFWLKGDWQNCLNWFHTELSIQQINQDSNLIIYYLRCLGENGKIEELLNYFTKIQSTLIQTGDKNKLNLARMILCAFLGKTELVEEILTNHLDFYPKNTQLFWIATAQFYGEQKKIALDNFKNLQGISHQVLINNINYRLNNNFININSNLNNPQSDHSLLIKQIEQIKSSLEDEKLYRKITKINTKKSYLTQILIMVNLLVFLLEIQTGGSTNLQVLEKLGALIPEYVENGQYWRLIMANFLHYGWLHLSMNMLGLWIVGTFVERIIGRFYYGLIYFISGIGGMIIFTLIAPYTVSPNMPILLVGASGAIMGLVGVILAIFIKLTYLKKSPIFAERLRLLLLIILIQFIFDFFTPQVSFMIHALGFMLGLIIGLFVPIKIAKI